MRIEHLSQSMRLLVRGVCALLLIAAIGVVGWMGNAISQDNIDTFRDWNSLYDYITVGGVVLACFLLGATTVSSGRGVRLAIVLVGVALLATGIGGHYGFKYLSDATLAPIPPMKQLRPNASKTVLGFHYLCPTSGGYVAFGDGAVKYVDREQFAKLRHADTPDQPPEFVSPAKEPSGDESSQQVDQQEGTNALARAQERINHSNNLKQMAVDHLRFKPRDGIRVPLKPEHFNSYRGMPDELRKAISDGTYVWYFGWEPIVSYATERTRALWYDFASWASIYLAALGAGSLLAGLVLMMKGEKPTPVAIRESA
jgi:hypothetical protein